MRLEIRTFVAYLKWRLYIRRAWANQCAGVSFDTFVHGDAIRSKLAEQQ